ncbi:MAG: aminotransferase class V-fold PLP-dependent enzyme, partial [Candidatus Levyibacteriota bacterium]
MKNIKKDFPIFKTHPKLVYLDSASTSQKPHIVIDAVSNFYIKSNSNVHRGIYDLSQEATDIYEGVRKKVADLIHAKPGEIIFTGNTTEGINLAVFGYFKKHLKKGDIVILSEMEHHSNIVPWLMLKEQIGIKTIFLPLSPDFSLDYARILDSNINFKKIKAISLTYASNVLGTVNPLEKIIKAFRKKNPQMKILVDAAQSISHLKTDVKKIDADFLAFSSHKMFGPAGLGVLYVKEELLGETDPLFYGGHMITEVTKNKASFSTTVARFEAGTGRLESVAGLGAAIEYINKLGFEKIANRDNGLTSYAFGELSKLDFLQLYSTGKNTL